MNIPPPPQLTLYLRPWIWPRKVTRRQSEVFTRRRRERVAIYMKQSQAGMQFSFQCYLKLCVVHIIIVKPHYKLRTARSEKKNNTRSDGNVAAEN